MFHQTNFTFNEELAIREEGATRHIILHHSEVTSPHTAADIHQWHQNKGWAGIGYHYFIAKDGDVYEGRPRDTVGAHTKGHNRDSVGICFEGDFNKEELCEAQERAAVKLITILSIAYPDADLHRHHDFNPDKSCPGKNFPFERLYQRVVKSLERMGLPTFISQNSIFRAPRTYTFFDLHKIIQNLREDPKRQYLIEAYEACYGPITQDMEVEDFSFYQDYLIHFDTQTALKGLTLRTDMFSTAFHQRFEKGTEPQSLDPQASPDDIDLLQRLIFSFPGFSYELKPSEYANQYELHYILTHSKGTKAGTFHDMLWFQQRKILNILFRDCLIQEAKLVLSEKQNDEDAVSLREEIFQNRRERVDLYHEQVQHLLQQLGKA